MTTLSKDLPSNALPIPVRQDGPASVPLPRRWSLREVGTERWLPATVPGCNFTDLMEAGDIADPFVGDNFRSLQWIEERDWEYRTTFFLEPGAEDLHADLVFEGLDTYATVRLNGDVVLESDNMFRRYRVCCDGRLRAGDNELSVTIRSPLAAVRDRHERGGITYPAENDDSEAKLSVYTRKAACHFGWDWAPRLVSSGICRPAYLEVVPHCRIADAAMTVERLEDDSATVSFAVEVDAREAIDGVVRVLRAGAVAAEAPLAMPPGRASRRLSVIIDEPRRWWPRGLGEAHLYAFDFEVVAGERTLAALRRRFGLRTIEFVNQPDEHGRSFYFKINGLPVFIRGANYIPPDMFAHRVDDRPYRQIFADVVQANINMLRVWGGGAYESPAFYDLADEHGILVWQDFMFANTLYPADEAFLANVSGEVADVVRRLRHHACLALWCGNNEIDMGIACWDWPAKFAYTDAQFAAMVSANQRLFRQLIPDLVATHDPGRADCYLPSSPQSFWEKPSTAGQGNSHYWGVWHGGEEFPAYRENVPRFMTEFGFQSFPGAATVARYAGPEDWDVDSAAMRAHQRHATGNERITEGIRRRFGVAPGFANMLYLSQVLQAEGVRIGIEAHRLARPYCMGTVYWQLNDAWPGASWSGIDYFGRWKALHYEVRRSFEPTTLCFEAGRKTVTAHVVNDRNEPLALTVDLEILRFSGEPVWAGRVEVAAAGGSVTRAWRGDVAGLAGGRQLADCVLVGRLRGGGVDVTRCHYFGAVRGRALTDPGVVAAVGDRNTLRLEATASLARYVRVSQRSDETANFSDNFFDLLPGRPVEIAPPEGRSVRLSGLKITSLVDALRGA
ncbi:MAG: glycoside hydrolase family 2 protein [Proteobacteria bacterium]|nr:glycoside hydrolase family 2 protein [Pseudomonadota bacterium]